MKDLNEGEFASKAHVFVPTEDQMHRGLGEVLQSKDWPMRMEGGRGQRRAAQRRSPPLTSLMKEGEAKRCRRPSLAEGKR